MKVKLVLGIGFVAAAIVALLFFLQVNNLKSQLQQSKTKSEQLQSQLQQSNAESEQLQSQLAQDESQIAQLQPLANKARQMPIKTKFLELKGLGYELQVFNLSQTAALRIGVTVTALNKNKSFTPVIDGRRPWILRELASGDQIEIVSDGYNSINLTVPQ